MIYFILNIVNGLIKIGFATDPKRRIQDLQTGSCDPLQLLATMPGTLKYERYLHKKFDSKRVWGEWFDISERQVEELLECAEYIASRQRQEMLQFEKPAPRLSPDTLVFKVLVQAA